MSRIATVGGNGWTLTVDMDKLGTGQFSDKDRFGSRHLTLTGDKAKSAVSKYTALYGDNLDVIVSIRLKDSTVKPQATEFGQKLGDVAQNLPVTQTQAVTRYAPSNQSIADTTVPQPHSVGTTGGFTNEQLQTLGSIIGQAVQAAMPRRGRPAKQ